MDNLEEKIKIFRERIGFTAMLPGRWQKDKRHTNVQMFAKSEKTARKKLEKWIVSNLKVA